jgi:creatinine amidohydrolase
VERSVTNEILYSVRGPKSWVTMTSQELTEKLAETDVCVVPVGAIEQHAGHLPLGQDNFQVEEIVRRAVLNLEAEGKKAIFGPTIPYGPVPNLRFPGSIDIKPSTLVILVKEICFNLYRDGIKNIALVMGHDMSLGALMVAARELACETDDDLNVVVLNWLPIVINFLPEVREKIPMEVFDKVPKNTDGKVPTNALEGHGGAGETGRMLWQHPELVVKKRLRDYPFENPAPPAPFIAPIFCGGGVYTPRKTTNHDPKFEGIFGYPSIATEGIGDGSYEAIANWVAIAVKTLCYRSKT